MNNSQTLFYFLLARIFTLPHVCDRRGVSVGTCYLQTEKEASAPPGHMTSQLIISTSA